MLKGRRGSTESRDTCDFFGVTGTNSTSLWSIRSERGLVYECVDDGFVGEGGVFDVVDEDDKDVADDEDDEDDREELLEVNESSEPDDAFRSPCAKYWNLIGVSMNGEGDRGVASN